MVGSISNLMRSVDLKLNRRPLNVVADRDFLLRAHCSVNYECESGTVRQTPYAEYEERWLKTRQADEFFQALSDSLADSRTVAEIWETNTGNPVAYVWMTFFEIRDYGLSVAELRDIFVTEEFRRQGIADSICRYCIRSARASGAGIIRSGTGACNVASQRMHAKLGFSTYRFEYEKTLER